MSVKPIQSTAPSFFVKAIQLPAYPFTFTVRWIKSYILDRKNTATAMIFLRKLEELEKLPAGTNGLSATLQDAKNFLPNLQASSRAIVIRARQKLSQEILSHEYRLGKTLNYDDSVFNRLKSEAARYKSGKRYFKDKALTDKELNKLKEMACYGDFANQILQDPSLKTDFFRWTIVNDNPLEPFSSNPIEVFVKFSGLRQSIFNALSSRSSRFGGGLFRIDKNSQVAEILIEGKWVPISKDFKAIELKGWRGDGKRTLTIDQIFSEIHKKIDSGYGDIEMLNNQGLWLHNPAETGAYHEDEKRYKRVDLKKLDFFKQFPVQEELTKEEVEKRYQIKVDAVPQASGQHWVGCPDGKAPLIIIKATQVDEKQLKGTHSYYGFITPNEKGLYEVRTTGEFVFPFPIKWWELLFFTARYHASRYFDIDENIFCAGREHTFKVITPTATSSQWEMQLKDLRWKIEKGWESKLGFHMVLNNCTAKIWKSSVKIFGLATTGDWRINVWDLNPSGLDGEFYNWLKRRYFRIRITRIIFFFLGSWRGMYVAKRSGGEKYVSMSSFLEKNSKLLAVGKKKLPHPSALFTKH